jgi:hypothetical protein
MSAIKVFMLMAAMTAIFTVIGGALRYRRCMDRTRDRRPDLLRESLFENAGYSLFGRKIGHQGGRPSVFASAA